ncbi:hypothetical protein [Sphingomonas parapaucimobilis]|uniref:hypothetical protein n=1 Tax=Sphingomonas parapaucimobilis TaxID=28213 RepID=UPI003219E77E
MSGQYQRQLSRNGMVGFSPQRDEAVDAGTIGLFDFGHGWGYFEQVTPMAAASQLRNYVRLGGAAVADTAVPWTGNMVKFDTVGQSITLPPECRLPANCTDFAVAWWGKIPKTGYPSGGSGQKAGQVLGCASGGFVQYTVSPLYDGATGNLNSVQLGINFEGPTVPASTFPDDNSAHHYLMRWRVVSATKALLEFYIDGALRFSTADLNYNGALAQPDRAPRLGQYWTNVPDALRGSIGRIVVQRLDIAGSKRLPAMLAAEIAAGRGRFS